MARGILADIGFTEAELLSIRDKAREAISKGLVVLNYSDSGTSVGKAFTLPVDVVLDEVKFALRKLNPEVWGRRRRFLISDLRGKDFS
jgi:hypothetical protein